MTRKRTLYDYALWAALPIAHTSKVEGRIKMVLDTTRRRTSPRRFLALAVMAGAAALVPLSMLQPIAKAQVVSQVAQGAAEKGTVQLIGIFNTAMPDAEWDANGTEVSSPVIDRRALQAATPFTAKPGQKALFFAFHMPQSIQNSPRIYDVSGTTPDGITITQMKRDKTGAYTEMTTQSFEFQLRKGPTWYGAAFPIPLLKADVRVGTVSGPWTTAAVVPHSFRGEYAVTNSPGSRFSSTRFSVFDGKLLFNPSIQPYPDLQNLRFFAVNKEGQRLLLHLTLIESRDNPNQTIMDLPQPLSHLKEIRVETRHIAWTEFKDVALQPQPLKP